MGRQGDGRGSPEQGQRPLARTSVEHIIGLVIDLPMLLAAQSRHRAAVEEVLGAMTSDPDLLGILLLGSFAAGTADALSDLDLLLVVEDDGFERVWEKRALLHRPALFAWDLFAGERPVGAHKWLTSELVLVECLIAEPGSGVRLAEPFVRLSGPVDLPDRLTRRAPILRGEVTGGAIEGNMVEALYDAFKHYVREAAEAAGRSALSIQEGKPDPACTASPLDPDARVDRGTREADRASHPDAPPGKEGKYARVERERRFLLAAPPVGTPVRRVLIEDRYLRGTRLRLRRITDLDVAGGGATYKLTQKIPAEAGGPGLITTVYLSAAEYAALDDVPADTLRKIRSSFPPLGVDTFVGPLTGLVLAEAEFETAAAETSFARPAEAIAEVTNDARFTGGCLVTLRSPGVLDLLAGFGIRPT